MQKRILSLFLTILLTGFIITPVVLLTIDDSIDISIFYNVSEEENVNVLNLEDFNITKNVDLAFFKPTKGLYTPTYCFKNYLKPQLNLLLPPPEAN